MSPNFRLAAKVLITFLILFIFLEILMKKFNLRNVVSNPSLYTDYKGIGLSLTFFLSLITSYIGFLFAKKKNRDRKTWIVLCFFLNIWGVIILLFLPKKSTKSECPD